MKRSLTFVGVFCVLVLAPALLFSQASWTGKPVQLSIIDVAGNLKLSKPAIEAFKAANPRSPGFPFPFRTGSRFWAHRDAASQRPCSTSSTWPRGSSA
jgi:hypothetical protein